MQSRTPNTPFQNKDGSALIAVMLFAFMVSMVLGAVLPAALNHYKNNLRNSRMVAAIYLAEAGADEALWALNHYTTSAEWENDGWEYSADGAHFIKLIDLENETFQLNNNESGTIRIIVDEPVEPGHVSVFSEGTVAGNSSSFNSQPIVQVVALTASVKSPFMGLIAKDNLSFSGQPTFDSYNSSQFPYAYSPGVNTYKNTTVGSISAKGGSVNIGNADVYGDIVSGASDPLSNDAVQTGPNANISGQIIGDYDQEFPEISPPDTSTADWNNSF